MPGPTLGAENISRIGTRLLDEFYKISNELHLFIADGDEAVLAHIVVLSLPPAPSLSAIADDGLQELSARGPAPLAQDVEAEDRRGFQWNRNSSRQPLRYTWR